MTVINDRNHVIIQGENVKILRSDDYRYIWSLKHKKNSGIINRLFPENYIDAVKNAEEENKYIVIDIPEELESAFIEAGIELKHVNQKKL